MQNIQCKDCLTYFNPQTVKDCPICKLNSVKPILNSQNISETEITGLAKPAISDTDREHRAYRILIFGDEAERTRALTQIIAIPCVSIAINIGEVMGGKNTLRSKKSNLAKKVIKV